MIAFSSASFWRTTSALPEFAFRRSRNHDSSPASFEAGPARGRQPARREINWNKSCPGE